MVEAQININGHDVPISPAATHTTILDFLRDNDRTGTKEGCAEGAVAFALDIEDGTVGRARIGLGGVAATPIRARAAEEALTGRPWSAATVEVAAELLQAAGTPLEDHRASARYRSAMLGQSLRKLYAETTEAVPS
ncbi:hypothetical protein ACIP5Y_38080 [Nocardia sp. NPDC088792]|uniref:hypothetical protein n=1 Tax=Nocardia sp. NPDC088792 TaxID=3364332 RepID=UPI00382B2A2F